MRLLRKSSPDHASAQGRPEGRPPPPPQKIQQKKTNKSLEEMEKNKAKLARPRFVGFGVVGINSVCYVDGSLPQAAHSSTHPQGPIREDQGAIFWRLPGL